VLRRGGAARAPGRSAGLAQLHALAHPLRVRLFELFARTPRTAKQAAEHLRLPPTRLYHHVAALERVGLVRLVETRRKRGTIEKYFSAVALRVGAEAASGEATRGRRLAADALTLSALVLERAREDCLAARGMAGRSGQPVPAPTAARVAYHFDAARLPRARRALMAVMKRLRALSIDPRTGPAPRWTLTLALVPAPDISPAPARGPRRGSSARTFGPRRRTSR